MKVQYFRTENRITLYWEKPEMAKPEHLYEIYVDGIKRWETDKTHFTITDLEADTEYLVEIKNGLLEEALTVSTAKAKYRRNVTEAPYFANAEGKVLVTEILQQAINDCGPSDVLYFPKGTYMTGALKLHSNLEIYLDEGAILQGTDEPKDYLPKIWSRFEGVERVCYSSVLNLGELDQHAQYNCHDVFIHGKGTIASGGESLGNRIIEVERARLSNEMLKEADRTGESDKSIPRRMRPRLINISNAQNIIISGLTLKNGASWNVHMIYSDNIITHNCTFISEGVHNGDGWDPDSSTNCTLFGCTFFTGDDSVAIKSGKNPEGNLIGKPCKHIRIFDCVSKYGHGICIGSEMSGGVEDVKIWDCDLRASLFGLEIKGTKKRGGYVRDVMVRDCVAPRLLLHSVPYNDDGIGAETVPVFEGFKFEGITLTGIYQDMEKKMVNCGAIEVCGFDEPDHQIRNVKFKDITLGDGDHPTVQTIQLQYCEGISLENIRCLFNE